MSEPFHVLAITVQPPELWGSAYGPFVVQHCPTLSEAAEQLRVQPHDAVLIELKDPSPLLAWPALSHAVLDAAVVLLTPEPDVALAVRLLQMGVQDVVPPGDAPALARVLRLAIERKGLEKAARKELKRLERTPEAAGEYSMVRTYLEWLIELPWADDPGTPVDLADARRILDEDHLPEDARKVADRELRRLESMGGSGAEVHVIRNYLELIADLPWDKRSGSEIDLDKIQAQLESDHYGLADIKKRILEHVAVLKLSGNTKGTLLCFVGPPGVGKTSLGQSIADATGRPFIRVALGGVRDEAEIRGHRRTYVGALPGNVLQSLRKAGTRHAVMMLDEVDKLGAGGFQGDPASALLEVLDPEQNATFRDNYLALPYDLSHVMFLCTANVLDTIPGPLRDRMEIIALPGYTAKEKLEIARRYLVPRQREANGVTAADVELGDDAIAAIIEDYTREAGVRNLEREIGRVFRHAALDIAEKGLRGQEVGAAQLQAILGPRKFEAEVAMRTGIPGVATGLAWTPVGGDILFIEASRSPGNGKLALTGQLGDVMKESAQAALSLVKARERELGIAPEVVEKSDLHVHVPAGATPKDGPSAGVKEKVLAAQRAGIATVMLPKRNERDLEDVPADARSALRFVWMETIEDALRGALDPAPATTDAGR
jgi:ATP-dependent Lon protease